jgi:acyl-CoA synthetase (AMP-forming)/AMP-acid ligase II
MNVSDQITDIALKLPYKMASSSPSRIKDGKYLYSHYTFIQLEERINQFSNKLVRLGVKRGDKVLVFVKPCLDFAPLVFALFKIGAVSVFIDPGMGKDNFLKAVEQVNPQVLIGVPKVHLIRLFFKKYFSSIRVFINFANWSFFGAKSILKKLSDEQPFYDAIKPEKDEMAAILFTSGGTGIPKGVVYTHEIFIEQTKMLKEEFSLNASDVDIPGFPLFAMFTLSMGMTSYIPDMDPSKPAKANPEKLVKNIMDSGATFVAGSPSIWQNVSRYCLDHKITLPTVRVVCMFGAPIPNKLHHEFSKFLPNGTTYTPYGATECLPIANISGREVLLETAKLSDEGHGVCVGYPLKDVDVKIIKSTPEIISHLSEAEFLKTNEVGEIIVNSITTTKLYYHMELKTREAKIQDGDKVWHRMGDVGYFDDKGKLWFCGRKSHVVTINDKSHYTIPVESIVNQHPEVLRSALIEYKDELALVIERYDGKDKLDEIQRNHFFSEIYDVLSKFKHTKDIHHLFLSKSFPVDVRHNIKIDRIKLKKMAKRGELR